MTAVEGNASVYQVNPVSRITGEGRAELLRTWGPGFDQKGGGRGGGDGCPQYMVPYVPRSDKKKNIDIASK